ncbi:MAG: redoxin domain-containing protein [Deltaproteobacteria bacterium]|nr:redoxin domain-containing protein [Deltaproteobacteria bacterium]
MLKFIMLPLIFAFAFGLLNPESTRVQSLAGQRIFHAYAKPMRAPDFSLEDLQGKVVNIQDYSGKVILINFWATW